MEGQEFLGRGWAFPPRLDRDTGGVALSEYVHDVKEAIRIILETSKGERVMRPDFGCGIHDLVFASIDSSALGFVESSVREALLEFEPRVELEEVSASIQDALRGQLSVDLKYRLREANRRDNLVYSFYLQGNS